VTVLMQKAQKFDLASSNVAGLGSKANHELKHDASLKEGAWKGCGQKEGIEIWRVEKFKIVAWPQKYYGSFFSGDAYVLLHTTKKDGKLMYKIHFWLGEKSTQDEQGTAAYKTVELDDLLNGAAPQVRECQHYETEEFLEMFQHKVIYMEGGVGTGFHHVSPAEYKPRLMLLAGKGTHIRVKEVELKRDSLCSQDVAILDNGLELYQWNGASCNAFEKRKAGEIIQGLRSDRDGKPKVVTLDDQEDNATFWKLLGGKGKIKDKEETTEAKKGPNGVSLFQLHKKDKGAGLAISEVATGAGNIKKSMLKTDDVFILDSQHETGDHVYVWIGKGAPKEERAVALTYAADYLHTHKRPLYTPMLVVKEGFEVKSFLKHFS